jgi:hypothetical protein
MVRVNSPKETKVVDEVSEDKSSTEHTEEGLTKAHERSNVARVEERELVDPGQGEPERINPTMQGAMLETDQVSKRDDLVTMGTKTLGTQHEGAIGFFIPDMEVNLPQAGGGEDNSDEFVLPIHGKGLEKCSQTNLVGLEGGLDNLSSGEVDTQEQ